MAWHKVRSLFEPQVVGGGSVPQCCFSNALKQTDQDERDHDELNITPFERRLTYCETETWW